MNKKRVILVETDENYISNLEIMLISHEESLINLELITDREYLRYFISTPQIIDCLIIDEDMLTDEVLKQNVGHLFVLTERVTRNFLTASSGTVQMNNGAESISSMRSATKTEYVDKYGAINELFHKIIGAMNLPADDRNNKSIGKKDSADIILVTSQIGGVGKTRAAFSLALRLTELNRSVLYISLDEIQRNHIYAGINDYISEGLERDLINKDENVISYLDRMIYHEMFDYFLPWNCSRCSMGLAAEHYIFLIGLLKSTGKYDYIILDDNGSFDDFSQEMMAVSDRIINIMTDSFVSEAAFTIFETELRSSERGKIICVVNRGKGNPIQYIDEEIAELIPEYIFYGENWLYDLRRTEMMKDIAMLLV